MHTSAPPPRLPELLAITDSRLTNGRPLREVLAACVAGGLRAVIVRDKHLPLTDRRRLVAEAEELLVPLGGLVIVASSYELGGRGVHLSARDAKPDGYGGVLGRSCHDGSEVEAAAAEGCAYVSLSPIFPSRSKPGYGPCLGVEALTGHAIPVVALGGVDAQNAASCLAAGASAIAVMSALMSAEDPAAATEGLLDALAVAVARGASCLPHEVERIMR